MVRRSKENAGFALLLTILIVGLIVAVTLQFNSNMWAELHAAANLRDGIRLGCVARSGFDYALAVLYEDGGQNDFDSLREVWADPQELSSPSGSMFQQDRFEVEIKDLTGKIQVNSLMTKEGKVNDLQRALLEEFLKVEEFGLEEDEARNIVNAIIDWIDSNDEPILPGGEENYQSLDKPYSAKNEPLDFLEELLLVKGITKELFYGTEDKPGIARYMSVHAGDGRININTADPLILKALSLYICGQDLAREWVDYRENEDNDISTYIGYYGLQDKTTKSDQLITTKSTHFEIRATGIREVMKRVVTGVVERNNQERSLRVLSWKVE